MEKKDILKNFEREVKLYGIDTLEKVFDAIENGKCKAYVDDFMSELDCLHC